MPQLSLGAHQPQLSSLSSDAQKEALTNVRDLPEPNTATTCASVTNEPSTSSFWSCRRKDASSIWNGWAKRVMGLSGRTWHASRARGKTLVAGPTGSGRDSSP